jgi:hypothetical protein
MTFFNICFYEHYNGVQHGYSKIRKCKKSETFSDISISDKGYRNVISSIIT